MVIKIKHIDMIMKLQKLINDVNTNVFIVLKVIMKNVKQTFYYAN